MWDIIYKYDEALLNWLVADYALLVPAYDTQVLFTTPDRQYADFVTKKYVDNRMLRVPRIALDRQEPPLDPYRYNDNRIPKLTVIPTLGPMGGYGSARFPAPILLPYTVKFWTDKMWHMDKWLAKFMWQFKSGCKQFTIHVNDTWGDKDFYCYWKLTQNTSDLEPQEQGRLVRYDITFDAKAWIFDEQFDQLNPDGTPMDPKGRVPAVGQVTVSTEIGDPVEEVQDYPKQSK